ncbi:AAA family ATPase [Lysinibacillus antri]|uniref:AAA domain-containing protein n=1 Tax=Lysinibacillus antri TaxID=2498145 RepID=A0A3S0P6P8_9BACI|nr:AAA family ATPase [Lysinibacillus antri]RUL49581.1 hypothetical protein EK386_14925 [Lysinibacillus antri]
MIIQWLCHTRNTDNFINIKKCMTNGGYSLIFQEDKEEIHRLLTLNPNAAIIIDINEGEENYQYCESLSILHPQAFIILAGEEVDLNVMKALRCGAKDILSTSSNEGKIVEVINRVEKAFQIKGSQNRKNGRIITACSTKGGVGKTTLIVNLATVLAKQNYQVAVLDLNLQFGDVSLYYDIKPKKTIYEWVKEEYDAPMKDLSKFMSKHSSGVDILPAPIRPEFSEAILDEHIHELIKQCKETYDYILIDTPPYLTEHTLTSLEKSNDILLMTFMDIATLKNNKIYIETLEALSLKEKVKVILNREYKVRGIQPGTVEKILELPVFARIPNKEKHITTSINEGKPLTITNPKSSFSKSILKLASNLSGNQVQKASKKQLQPR